MAANLIHLGHDVEIYRSCSANDSIDPENPSFARFFSVDDCAVSAHESTSSALIRHLEQDPPDVLLVKGLLYRLTADTILQLHGKSRIGAIIGGATRDPLIEDKVDFLLEEFTGQVPQEFSGRPNIRFKQTYPKFIEWDFIDESLRHDEKKFDVINVGNFFEIRKNQEAIIALGSKYRLCLVGEGDRLAHFKALTEGSHSVLYPGLQPRAEVMRLVQKSKLMVHPSLWEGFPRAVAESLACGVPVVAFQGVLGQALDPDWSIASEPFEILQDADKLLRDNSKLAEMSMAAEEYARKTYNLDRITQVLLEAISTVSG